MDTTTISNSTIGRIFWQVPIFSCQGGGTLSAPAPVTQTGGPLEISKTEKYLLRRLDS